jgi:hypothetical protein
VVKSRLAVHGVLLLLLAGMAGCVSDDTPSPSPDTSPSLDAPAREADFSVVPTWELGDKWVYETEGGSFRETFSVSDIEEWQGQTVYFRSIATDDGDDIIVGFERVAAIDLGTVWSERKVFHEEELSDCRGYFPLVNRTLECHASKNGLPDGARIQRVEVGPTEEVLTPLGKFQAKPVRWYPGNSTAPSREEWYAPDTGWIVQYRIGSGELPRLIETTYSD